MHADEGIPQPGPHRGAKPFWGALTNRLVVFDDGRRATYKLWELSAAKKLINIFGAGPRALPRV